MNGRRPAIIHPADRPAARAVVHSLPGPPSPGDVDERLFLEVLAEVTTCLDGGQVPHGVMGGIASAALGRARWTHDIDLFVRHDDGSRALALLDRAGFRTEETNPHWIFKAFKHGILVDLIFRAKGDIYLDEAMAARLVRTTFRGVPVRVLPPEDLIVIKAIIHDEETPRHWYDAMGVIAAQHLDWDYLIERASAGPKRLLSLMLYAQSCDVVVPDSAIHKLMRNAYPL